MIGVCYAEYEKDLVVNSFLKTIILRWTIIETKHQCQLDFKCQTAFQQHKSKNSDILRLQPQIFNPSKGHYYCLM